MSKHLLSLASVLVACSGGVPPEPTWFADVQPIVRANCARCHGADPADPKIAGYRLDRYVAMDPAIDAFDYAATIIEHAVDHEIPAMPPDYALTDRQQEILVRWLQVREADRKGSRGNDPGRIELLSIVLDEDDQNADVTVRSWDRDLDGLIVQLVALDLTTNKDWPLGKPVGGGMRTVVADAGALPSKTFELSAIVDDGYSDTPGDNQMNRIVLLPELYIDHGLKGTAPTVTLLTPNGGDTQLGTMEITWAATDPDVDLTTGAPDVLTISLDLVSYAGGTAGEVHPIASLLTNSGGYTWAIPASIPARDLQTNTPIPYRVRVTATDEQGSVPHNVRSDESDLTFLIEESVVTSYRWVDANPAIQVKNLFITYCGTSRCHDNDGVPKRPDLCAPQYQQGEDPVACDPATDKGIYEYRNLVLTKVSTFAMPPGGSPQPSAMDRDKVIDWIKGGAPYGNGSSGGNTLVFTWTAPASTRPLTGDPLVASGGTAQLMWTVSDDSGLADDAIFYRKTTAPNCSNDCLTVMQWSTSWMEITLPDMPTGTTMARSFSWTIPPEGAGCYCVEGTMKNDDTPPQSLTQRVRSPNAVKF